MKIILITILFYCSILLSAQEPIYFNEIYSDSILGIEGFSIIDNGQEYVGYASIWDITSPQRLVFFKMNYYGEILNWKILDEPNHNYYPGNVGGAMKLMSDSNYCIGYHLSISGVSYGRLMKLDTDLDTIWTQYYSPEYNNVIINATEVQDGFLLTGWVWYDESSYSDAILLKTDENGNYLWHQTYGDEWAEHGQNVIQTPDGGYLIGGYFWKPGIDHSLDAMVVKTDSLGNEQWTHYYGNPEVDDDMAFVELADDGNYLIAMIYGEYIYSSDNRIGKFVIYNIDSVGNIIEERKYGDVRLDRYIKNFKKINSGYMCTGFSYITDSVASANFTGWSLKLDNNLDSVWIHDYYYFSNLWDVNYLNDVSITSDNGYIAIGQANETSTHANMWIIKLDSMGCDTPGCATGVQVFELTQMEGKELKVWPNPTRGEFFIQGSELSVEGDKCFRIYNLQGVKVEEINVPMNSESIQVNVSSYPNGMFYLQYIHSNRVFWTGKFIKN